MKVCLIPARGGSKRIPRKNIKNFCGKPMIAWSIEAAQKATCFDRIIVSTDDEKIAEVARAAGAEVPFTRPEKLSDDHATTQDVVAHALEVLGPDVQTLCCLYATAPFVQVQDILAGEKALQGADYAFPVTSFPFPIQRAVKIDADGRLDMFSSEHLLTRSQDLEEAYHDAGQFYWGTAEAWKARKPIFGSGSVPVILPRWRVQDIDTPEDWKRAELMHAALFA